MKKIAACLAVVLALAGVYFYCMSAPAPSQSNYDYLRIHVRANSNAQSDQDVKYIVKDEVVKFITPYIGECVDKASAMRVIGGLLEEITEVCVKTLETKGYNYGARARICEENFPTRVYEDFTLEAGIYDALIIELGTGTGDNWWCVIYPPLCFTSAPATVEYRSVIYDIINKFKNK